MAVNTLEAKQHAHHLVDQLGPGQIDAVIKLLEAMVHRADEEPVTEEDRRRFQDSRAWLTQRNGEGIPMEDVLAEFGLKLEDFPLNK